MNAFARVERAGSLTMVTLDRPEVLNALHLEAHEQLADIFDRFAADPDQHVAIITGAGGRAFCAGSDLKSAPAGAGTPASLPATGFAGLTSRFDLDKPVIAAVNGVAMGGGFELALTCDIIVASENALFALPEPQVGLVALAGGPVRLARAIGEKRAMELVLTSRRLSARDAAAIGLVAEVVGIGDALAAARCIAERIAAAGPLAIRASKQLMQRGLDVPLAHALHAQWDLTALATLFASNDVVEGPRAFAEKRAPVWQGR